MITSKFTSKTSKLLAITSNLHPNKGGGPWGLGFQGMTTVLLVNHGNHRDTIWGSVGTDTRWGLVPGTTGTIWGLVGKEKQGKRKKTATPLRLSPILPTFLG